MIVRALTNFSGAISMSKGDERDITNDVLLKDLLQAGYVVALEESEKPDVENTKLEDAGSEFGEYEGVDMADQESEDENSQTEEQEPEVATSPKKTRKKGVNSNENK